MDLNYLLRRRQVSLSMAHNAACESARAAHSELAELYASRIAAVKSAQPVAGTAPWNG